MTPCQEIEQIKFCRLALSMYHWFQSGLRAYSSSGSHWKGNFGFTILTAVRMHQFLFHDALSIEAMQNIRRVALKCTQSKQSRAGSSSGIIFKENFLTEKQLNVIFLYQ